MSRNRLAGSDSMIDLELVASVVDECPFSENFVAS